MSINIVKAGEKTTSGKFFKTRKIPVTIIAAKRIILT